MKIWDLICVPKPALKLKIEAIFQILSIYTYNKYTQKSKQIIVKSQYQEPKK